MSKFKQIAKWIVTFIGYSVFRPRIVKESPIVLTRVRYEFVPRKIPTTLILIVYVIVKLPIIGVRGIRDEFKKNGNPYSSFRDYNHVWNLKEDSKMTSWRLIKTM